MKLLSLFFFHQLKKTNLYFICCIVLLQLIGLLSLYSAAYGTDGGNIYLFKQQLLWIFFGWICFFFMAFSKTEFISKILWPLLFIHVICLILIFFIGKEVYSAKRWLDLSFFYYQPSETLKFVLSLIVAKQLSKVKLNLALHFKNLIYLGFFVIPPVLLVFLQPDLGTAGIILLIIATIVLFHGIEWKMFFSLLFIFVVSLPLSWSFLLKPYQKSRIISFINPTANPQSSGYSVIQSKIAIGSGQVFGKGFKKGTQNKLQFLPERHTDFIFSVLSEEYGFMGSIFTLALFLFLICFIFNLGRDCKDRLSLNFCIASGAFLMWHVVLNLAMTMGLFPVVGIPLPLMSYGGSNMLTVMTFLGLVAGIYRQKNLF